MSAPKIGQYQNVIQQSNILLSYGYPFLTDNSYNISISHTGKYVRIILNKYRKVGIDIEKISDKVLRVRNKYPTSSSATRRSPRSRPRPNICKIYLNSTYIYPNYFPLVLSRPSENELKITLICAAGCATWSRKRDRSSTQ